MSHKMTMRRSLYQHESQRSIEKILKKISLINLQHNTGFRRTNTLGKIKSEVMKLATEPYFERMFHAHSGGYASAIEMDNGDWKMLYEQGMPCLVPVIDENYIYLRSSLHEECEGTASSECIPNRETLQTSFNWQRLICIDDACKLDRQLLSMLSENLMKEDDFMGSKYIDIALFSIDTGKGSNPGKICQTKVNTSDFKKLIQNQSGELDTLSDLGYKFLAFRRNHLNTQQKENSQRKKQKENAVIDKKKQKTYVIFCDSLDLSALEHHNDEYCPNLRKIISQSTVFKKFTSVGGWTFPCLHSIHTDSLPLNQLSFFSTRVDPCLRLNNNHIPIVRKIEPLIQNLATKSNKYKENRDNYLTEVLANAGLITVGIKGSRNHGWFYGLNHAFANTIENCYLNRISSSLQDLIDFLHPNTFNVCFLDLDYLHRSHRYKENQFVEQDTNIIEKICYSYHKKNRLLGIVENKRAERSLYFDRLRMLDWQLGKIISIVDPEDNLIVFSDHGSDLFTAEQKLNLKYKNSSITSSKINNPTLIVRQGMDQRHRVSEELVSTIDLYKIILSLNGIKGSDSYSNLPVALGGEQLREHALTLSHRLESSEYDYSKITIETTCRENSDLSKCHEFCLFDGKNFSEVPNNFSNLLDKIETFAK